MVEGLWTPSSLNCIFFAFSLAFFTHVISAIFYQNFKNFVKSNDQQSNFSIKNSQVLQKSNSMNKSAIYLEKLQVLFNYCPRFKRLLIKFLLLLFIFFSATTTPYTQCFSIFNPTVYYTTGHSIVVADILKDLVNLESDVTGIQSAKSRASCYI